VRLALAISLAAVGPVSALTPLPPCVWDAETQRLGNGTTAPGVYAFVESAGDGFASIIVDGYEAYNYGPSAFILQHCPTGQELLIVLPEGDTTRFNEAYQDMVDGSRPYTMRQIAEALAPMGAGARMSENEFGNCACDWLYGEAAN